MAAAGGGVPALCRVGDSAGVAGATLVFVTTNSLYNEKEHGYVRPRHSRGGGCYFLTACCPRCGQRLRWLCACCLGRGVSAHQSGEFLPPLHAGRL